MNDLPPFQGVCTVCGTAQEFVTVQTRSIREDYPCPQCRCGIRFRDQAAIIVDEFGRGTVMSLAQLVRAPFMQDVRVYETSLRGPFIRHLSRLKGYVRSYFWEDRPLGETYDGVRNEDLRQLTFPDQSFDLVVTSDVFEHVFDPLRGFAEVYRVLRPGGIHVLSVPTRWPLDLETKARAVMEPDGRITHLQPEVFHTAGDGTPCLVVTDFGADLVETLNGMGYRTSAVRRSLPLSPAHRVLTFVCRRP